MELIFALAYVAIASFWEWLKEIERPPVALLRRYEQTGFSNALWEIPLPLEETLDELTKDTDSRHWVRITIGSSSCDIYEYFLTYGWQMFVYIDSETEESEKTLVRVYRLGPFASLMRRLRITPLTKIQKGFR